MFLLYQGHMQNVATSVKPTNPDLGNRVKSAVIWRTGTQILAQLISWGTTFAVIRILNPSDYGLFAMTTVIISFLNFLNGYGFASAIVQQDPVDKHQIRQAFGMLLLLNCALALAQLFIAAPLAADYYGEPVVAQMLRWQSLIYLATPFLVLPEALMTRYLEFKKPAIFNLVSAIVGASTALGMALAGYGVWTLVFAPISIFWSRAICLMLFTQFRYWPSFNFKGAGHIFSFGSMLLISHGFWIIQQQADIFIAGRVFDKHHLGLYATAVFLTTIFSAKFVPPLNDVAFPAYSKLQNDKSALAYGFLKAVRLIMLIACPFYFGMAVTATPFVQVAMGPKYIEGTSVIATLALAMPFMTLQILFHPAINAMGKPHITLRNSIFGAICMPVTFYFASQFGAQGLAYGWLVAFPLLLAFTYLNARKYIAITVKTLFAAVWPGLLAASCMASLVWLVDRMLVIPYLPDLSPFLHLAVLGVLGAATYVGMLWFGAKDTFLEVMDLVIKRKVVDPDEVVATVSG